MKPRAKSRKNLSAIVGHMAGASFTHFDAGGAAHMVDISAKAETHRIATATGRILMQPSTLHLITNAAAKKGDVIGIARIAAIQGAKRTGDLIPLSHPLWLSRVAAEFHLVPSSSSIVLDVTAETVGRTGVEMEALMGVSAGLLTIYDMCKAVDRGMTISDIHLLEKTGGKSGHFKWQNNQSKIASKSRHQSERIARSKANAK